MPVDASGLTAWAGRKVESLKCISVAVANGSLAEKNVDCRLRSRFSQAPTEIRWSPTHAKD